MAVVLTVSAVVIGSVLVNVFEIAFPNRGARRGAHPPPTALSGYSFWAVHASHGVTHRSGLDGNYKVYRR